MRELHIPGVEIPIYWTAWEFPNDAVSGVVHKRVFNWVKAKPSRSASVWRLANVAKTHWYIVAVAEHAQIMDALEKRIIREANHHQGEWYEIPEDEVTALVMRRAQDTLDALASGKRSDLSRERHFKGKWRLNSDGSLEPVDRPQG